MPSEYIKTDQLIILRDTREQIRRFDSPYWSQHFKVEDCTLQRGDYSFKYNGVDYSSVFAIEYKRVCELLANIGSDDRDKFKKKISSCAQGTDFYRIVVEGSLAQFVDPLFCGNNIDRFLAFTTIYKWESENRNLKFEFIPDCNLGTTQLFAEMVIYQYIEGFIKYYAR
ncbi:hypothetical protein E4H12_08475 [Candidatus Thorarchaeota archaeon]|nr:MAG: hypothetical protein E4H12_08475 [Candidatus Thorarchaeota archaeon]